MPVTSPSSRFSLIALGVVAIGFSTYAVIITPPVHDYGNVAVGAVVPFDFRFTESGAPLTDSITSVAITGADPGDFAFNDSTGMNRFSPSSTQSCYTPGFTPCTVQFRPKSFGPKQAKLVIKTIRGATATAVLKGNGVRAICEPLVVSCNYAFLYDGTFSWSYAIVSPISKTVVDVTVSIVSGRGVCNGSETITDNGNSTTGAITGRALVAVEFESGSLTPDSIKQQSVPIYRVTVACPTPEFPRTADSDGSRSQPAELGHNDQSSYNVKGVPIGSPLIGQLTYPAPETDQSNGVTGNVTVRWTLMPTTNAQPSIIRPGAR